MNVVMKIEDGYNSSLGWRFNVQRMRYSGTGFGGGLVGWVALRTWFR